MADETEEYDVGYGKPPLSGQFKPGKSGNPKGRPKGSKNAATLLEEELGQKVIIKENGRQKKITKKAAIFKQLVNRAVQGDPKATFPVVKLIQGYESKNEEISDTDINPDDAEAIVSLLARLKQEVKRETE